MKKAFAVLLATFAGFSLAVTPSHASQNYHLTTVSWVISTQNRLSVDDRYVTLVGQVTGPAGGGDYWFTDGTGSVRLDPGDFLLPVGRKITIGGRIDQAYLGIGNLEVDVKRWHPAGWGSF